MKIRIDRLRRLIRGALLEYENYLPADKNPHALARRLLDQHESFEEALAAADDLDPQAAEILRQLGPKSPSTVRFFPFGRM